MDSCNQRFILLAEQFLLENGNYFQSIQEIYAAEDPIRESIFEFLLQYNERCGINDSAKTYKKNLKAVWHNYFSAS